ncbi:hypothetical protein NQZ68_027167 [Dissostichus eleginoides]|nr:hypothetical protein NQZ68_027167 [Dissostichus eleginoides]
MEGNMSLQTLWDAIQQIKTDMLTHIDSKMDPIQSSLSRIQNSLSSLGDQVNLLEQRVGANEDNVQECVARVKQLEKDNSFLMSKVDDLENRSRRSNLRFIGILESAEGSDIINIIVTYFIVETLERCEILLGPEVTYGPPGLDLSVPLALTIAHCAEPDPENWSVSLKRKTQDSKWEEVMSVEDESTSCYCLLDCGSVHLLLDQPGSYALVGEPLTQDAVKRLKLAVFGGLEAMSYILRVYCVDDTPHAFQILSGSFLGSSWTLFWIFWSIFRIQWGVVSAERSRGGQLLEEPKTLPFLANTFSLQVSIQDVPQFLWSIKPFTTCQEFSFRSVWFSSRQHCAFSLQRFSPKTSQLSCKISVRQVKGHEQILQVYTAVTQTEKETPPSPLQTDSLSGPGAFSIPPSIQQRICSTFDTAEDWRLLAEKLQLQRNLGFFSQHSSPSAVILSLWEARHQDSAHLSSLAAALEEIGQIHKTSEGGGGVCEDRLTH